MPSYLVFRLYGALSAWGTVAVGEVRPVADHPSRSGVLGVIAASLGIRRHDSVEQARLQNDLNLALMELSSGSLLVDYQTVQAPNAGGKFVYRTRRDSVTVGRERLSGLQTWREYRCDAVWHVALWNREQSEVALSDIAAALRYPKFTVYAGRKSCPLALPMMPQIVEADGVRAAFEGSSFPPIIPGAEDAQAEYSLLRVTANRRYFWDGDAGDIAPQQSSERFDAPAEVGRRQFRSRIENSATENGGR